MIRKFGWIPDTEKDKVRDYKFTLDPFIKLPDKVDLTPKMPKVYNQGNLGSCVLNSSCAAVEYNFHVMHHPEQDPEFPGFPPSRLFAYYNTRVIENSINEDNGCMIRDAIKTLATDGVCSEALWNYLPTRFAEKPPKNCYKEAKKDIITRYERLTTIDEFRNCLAQGYPVIFGVRLYESFQPDKDGVIPMPKEGEEIWGGHSMLICGYDEPRQLFLVRNSWGTKWGLKGYCWMPYEYFIQNPDSDNWVIYYVI